MKKSTVIASSIVGVLVIVLIAVATYVGVMPGLSDVFAPKRPRDLGVTFTEQDFVSANAKMGSPAIEALPADTPPELSVVYEGSHETQFSITSAEISALADGGKWRYKPLTDIQVRVTDGGVEASAMLDTSKVAAYLAASGGGYEDVPGYLEKYGITGSVPVYFKGSGGVENGSVSMSVSSVQIGKYRFPGAVVSPYASRAIEFVESRLAAVDGLRVDSVAFSDGQLHFKGAVPDVERTAQ